MNIEEIRTYCLSKEKSSESFPFDDVTLVFKVANKMFALLSLDGELTISLKCDPELAIELREKYHAVQAAYHMNKKHWNSVKVKLINDRTLITKWIDHSYELALNSLPKYLKE